MMTRDQAIGMYVGMAVGDALGGPMEFLKANQDYAVGMTGGGVHNLFAGEWTDDTAMARCIAAAYGKRKKYCGRTIMKHFAQWAQQGAFGTRSYCFDIGNTCHRAIYAYLDNMKFSPVASYDEGNNGNGGIMRIAPAIIVNWKDHDRAVREGEAQSSLTHGSKVCRYLARVLASDLWRGSWSEEGYSFWPYGEPLEPSGWVVSTYRLAWLHVIETDNFASAVIRAVKGGGDADTIAAVTGMIAGRIYGYKNIPQEWISGLYMADRLKEEAEELYRIGEEELINESILSGGSAEARVGTCGATVS